MKLKQTIGVIGLVALGAVVVIVGVSAVTGGGKSKPKATAQYTRAQATRAFLDQSNASLQHAGGTYKLLSAGCIAAPKAPTFQCVGLAERTADGKQSCTGFVIRAQPGKTIAIVSGTALAITTCKLAPGYRA